MTGYEHDASIKDGPDPPPVDERSPRGRADEARGMEGVQSPAFAIFSWGTSSPRPGAPGYRQRR